MRIVATVVLSVSFVFVLAGSARAVTYTGSAEYSAGSGANKAAIVIDFDFNNSFMFDYCWDGQATGWSALTAIDTSGALDIVWQDYGWGIMIYDFIYPGGVKYDYGQGVNTGWAYYTSGDNENWQLSMVGVSDRQLVNGCWDSWVWTNYSPDWWLTYRTPGAQPIPEPATVLLSLSGLFFVFRQRKMC